jgi:hypothetical protein
LAAVHVRETTARAITTQDGKEFPLVRNGRFLQARIGKLAFPATLQAKVKFQSDAPEHLFDFTFERYSKDAPMPATTMTNAAPGATPARSPAPTNSASSAAAQAVAPAPPPSAPPGGLAASTPVPDFVQVAIPDTLSELLAQLRLRNDEIKSLIDRGGYASVYVPALQAKDLALALDSHRSELGVGREKMLESAVNRLVRHAYLLDAVGDLGNREQIVEVYARFAAAVTDVDAAFSKRPGER